MRAAHSGCDEGDPTSHGPPADFRPRQALGPSPRRTLVLAVGKYQVPSSVWRRHLQCARMVCDLSPGICTLIRRDEFRRTCGLNKTEISEGDLAKVRRRS